MRAIIYILICASCFQFADAQSTRTYNGTSNNLTNITWGSAGSNLLRLTGNAYNDSISAPAAVLRSNPRLISNVIYEQSTDIPNTRGISDFGWAWGQFIDHDITFVDDNQGEIIDISVPAFDPHFDPSGTGLGKIRMRRSKSDPVTGTSPSDPRMHVNDITAFIDGSGVYGSDSVRAKWLRTMQGGKLKTSAGDFLPYNTLTGEEADPIDPNAPFMIIEGVPRPKHFVAGDVRANEQPILTSFHTLFVREHNRLCDVLIQNHPSWSDEEIYQYARAMVSGTIQNITFYEWLPALGIQIPAFAAYDPTVNPSIMNAFSAAAYRLGHTLISSNLVRLDLKGDTIAQGPIDLKSAFFSPTALTSVGLEPYFQGMATQKQQNFDAKVIGDLRNFLFGLPGQGGLDLVAININRGRERGLVDYNTIRAAIGLNKVQTFADITSDAQLASNLLALYGSVNNIDPWVGMLAEDHVASCISGETVKQMLELQFTALRDGDRFYFEVDPQLSVSTIAEVKGTKLSDLIKHNSSITSIQSNVFFAMPFDSVALGSDPVSFQSFNVKLYPNPSSGAFRIRAVDSRGKANVEVIDLNGRILMRERISTTSASAYLIEHNLTPGIYFVRLIAENGIGTEKLVVE